MKSLVQLALTQPLPSRGVLTRLDPRSRLLALAVVLLCLVSHGKYQIAALVPYALFPLFMVRGSGAAAGPILARLALLAPFAVLVGLFNPWLDTHPLVTDLGIRLPGGWASFLAILLRFGLCLGSALAVAATLDFAALCRGASRLGVPAPLTTVVLFLGRYLHVLLEEGLRIRRAREARASGRLTWRSAGGVIGNLFLRTLDRSGRIQGAMAARGFTGEMPALIRPRWSSLDSAFLLLTATGALGWRLLSTVILKGAA